MISLPEDLGRLLDKTRYEATTADGGIARASDSLWSEDAVNMSHVTVYADRSDRAVVLVDDAPWMLFEGSLPRHTLEEGDREAIQTPADIARWLMAEGIAPMEVRGWNKLIVRALETEGRLT